MNNNPARAALIYNATGVSASQVASAAATAVNGNSGNSSNASAPTAHSHAPSGWDAVLAKKAPSTAMPYAAAVPGMMMMMGLPPPPRGGVPLPPNGLAPGAAIGGGAPGVGAAPVVMPSGGGGGGGGVGARAYVGRIPLDVGNDFLKHLLQLCGTLKEWNRIRDPNTGKDKAFGYAEYLSSESLARALRVLNGFVLFDSELLVKCDSATQLLIDTTEDRRRRDFVEAARARDPSLDDAAAERKWKAARVDADDRVELLAHRLFSLLFQRRGAPVLVDGEPTQQFVLDEAEVDSMPIEEVRAKLEDLRAQHNPRDKHARDAAAAAAAAAADVRRGPAHGGAAHGGSGAGGVPMEELSLNRGAPVEADVHVERERIDRKRMRELRARDERRRADHLRMMADDVTRDRMERDADRRDAERLEARRRAAEQRARAADELKELRRMCEDERERRTLRHSQRRRAERRAERDEDEAAVRREERDRREREAKEAAEAKARADAEAAAQAELERFTLKKTEGLSSIPLQLRNAASKRKVNTAVFGDADPSDEEALYQRKKNIRLTRLDDEENAAPSQAAVNWQAFDKSLALVTPLIATCVRDFLGSDDVEEFVSFVVDELRKHCSADELARAVEPVLDREADKFVQRVWKHLQSIEQ